MKLVYKSTGSMVQFGHEVTIEPGKPSVKVDYFAEPRSPASEGKVVVRYEDGLSREFYVSIIGAEWIEREDREEEEESLNTTYTWQMTDNHSIKGGMFEDTNEQYCVLELAADHLSVDDAIELATDLLKWAQFINAPTAEEEEV